MSNAEIRLSEKVARARLGELRARVPVLYALMFCNMAFLSASSAAEEQRLGALAVTALLSVFAGARAVRWRRMRIDALARAQVDRELRRASIMVALLGVGGVGVAIWLYPGVSGPSEPVNAFVALSIASVVYLLAPVAHTAYLAIVLIIAPYSLAMLATGDTGQLLLALNFVALACVLAFAVRLYARDFVRAAIDSHRARRRAAYAHRLYHRNEELARTDALTGLPNRRSFFDRLERLVVAERAGAAPFALGVLDLDNFKGVNDTFGHTVGDDLLRAVAERLTQAAPDGVWAGRLGGDEFGILVAATGDEAELRERAVRLVGSIRDIALEKRRDVRAGASLGLAVWPCHGRDAASLYEHADLALYKAKQGSRGGADVFTDALAAGLNRRKMIERKLNEPGFFDRIDIAFQPIFDTSSGEIVSLEALARWRDRQLGDVRPDEFVPICERNNLVTRLTVAMLRRAIAEARGWGQPAGVTINLSAQDLASDAAMLDIIAEVRGAGLPANRITFEITETTLIANFDKAARALDMLKRLGARIALDDFGNGYSALRYIRALPLDEVKIDRSLAEDIVADERARKLLESILALCANLDIEVVVEGVETARQVETLRAIGCARMQGWHFTKPLSPARTSALLDRAPAAAAKSA